MNDAHAAALVLAMAAATWLTRFLPFIVFRRRVPDYIPLERLGEQNRERRHRGWRIEHRGRRVL